MNEGLIAVLTKTGVFGWINVRVNTQQSCIKSSVRHECVHTHTLTVELLRAVGCGCGGTHALQRSEICPLCAIHRGCEGTHTFWRARIETFPCVPALSAVISLVIHWHRTLFLLFSLFFLFFFGGGGRFWWKFQVTCCLQLTWGYSVGVGGHCVCVCAKVSVLENKIYDIRIK